MMLKAALLGLVLGLALQTTPVPPEDYPGQREHREPPAGWYCHPAARGLAHRCTCKRMASGADCDVITKEDPQCKVWCHPSRCLCPVKCDVGGPHAR
jgi:hypothetical protein